MKPKRVLCVIACPKMTYGICPLPVAPMPVDHTHLTELGLDLKEIR